MPQRPENQSTDLVSSAPEANANGPAIRTWVVAALAIITILLFSRVVNHPFVNFDDPDYVTKNPAVLAGLSGKGVVWAFQATHSSNWHPLTWISHMVDVSLFGAWAGGHHLTNVFFHTANALLLFSFLRRTTRAFWPSVIVVALFAWHPLRVESVAWVAERKDVLSTFFGLLTLIAYAWYVERPRGARYALVVVAFAASLMAKPMLVTLPFLLLLLDYWPLRRPPLESGPGTGSDQGRKEVREGLRSLALEKVPLLLMALASCVVTVYAQKTGGAVASVERISLGDRLGNAVMAYAQYLWHAIWPVELAVFYPHPVEVEFLDFLPALAVLVVICGLILRLRRPYLMVGWLWYLGLLVPVIGIVQVGDQAMADRYTYVPMIGLSIAVVWGANEWVAHFPRLKAPIAALTAILLVALAGTTVWQLGHWSSPERLFTRALQVTRNNYVAHNNLGNVLDASGRHQEAKWHYEQTLLIRPDFAGSHYNLANSLAREQNYAEAMKHYRRAIELSPRFADAHYNYGVVLASFGELEKGIEHHRIAIQSRSNFAEARYNLGRLLAKQGKPGEAVEAYESALKIRPAWPEALIDLAGVLQQLGKEEDAIQRYSEALRYRPNSAQAHSSLGILHARRGNLDLAFQHFAEVVRIEPRNPDAHYNFGNVLLKQGKTEEAASQYRHVLQLNPDDAKAAEKLQAITSAR
jgi:protein O-mannosyl-transferase